MKGYAIIINETGGLSDNKIYLSKALAMKVIEEHDCTLDNFNNVLDNGTRVAKLVTVNVVAE